MMTDDMTDRLLRCADLLEQVYGSPGRVESDPVDVLVRTILSQNTTSLNTRRAFSRLKEAYPDYRSLLDAPDSEIAGQIRRGGLANTKAERIRGALEAIKRDAGAIDLGFLGRMDKEDAREYLLALPGVGPKTAAVVLLFAFGMQTMPVDTHVNRVSRRLGFVPPEASIEEAQRLLEKMTPPEMYCSLHVNLIRHGRTRCKAKNPLCEECVLEEICEYHHHRDHRRTST
ncbi:MAG: endonuclease III [Euryarchaeota archaeon]|nr:endonuclease III [Euryarchaeota archaeon]